MVYSDYLFSLVDQLLLMILFNSFSLFDNNQALFSGKVPSSQPSQPAKSLLTTQPKNAHCYCVWSAHAVHVIPARGTRIMHTPFMCPAPLARAREVGQQLRPYATVRHTIYSF